MTFVGNRSNLPLKGSRDYLHGTDTYNWLAGLIAPDEAPLTITFRRLIRGQMEIARQSGDPRVVAEFSIPGGRYVLIETDEAPTRRVPYDEDGITRDCGIEGEKISAPLGAPGCSPIELCVAMTKRLHHVALTGEKRKWLFARLELKRFFREEDLRAMSVEIAQKVETRFTKSTIAVGGEAIGSIYFSVIAG